MAELGGEQPLFVYYKVGDDSQHAAKLFRVSAYPSVLYIRKDKYWTYEGSNTESPLIEWVTKTRAGENGQGSEYPDALPTLWEDFINTITELKLMMKHFYRHNTIMFGTILIILVFIVSLCILIVY